MAGLATVQPGTLHRSRLCSSSSCVLGGRDSPSLSQSNCLVTAPRVAWLHSLADLSLHTRASALPKRVYHPDVTIAAHVPKWTRPLLRGVKVLSTLDVTHVIKWTWLSIYPNFKYLAGSKVIRWNYCTRMNTQGEREAKAILQCDFE